MKKQNDGDMLTVVILILLILTLAVLSMRQLHAGL